MSTNENTPSIKNEEPRPQESTPPEAAAPEPAPTARGLRRIVGRLRNGFLGPAMAVALVAGLVSSGATYAMVSGTASAARATSATTSTAAQLMTSSTDALVAAYGKAKASVVTISVTAAGGRAGQQVSGVGTGIVVSSNGLILTNRHVVDGATSIQVTLPDGSTVAGSVYGESSTNDLAIVKVGATGLTAATFGNSNALALGTTVLAIGNPLGEFTDSVTEGIVSGLNRSITVENEQLTGMIQTDAAINGGNSGGPLVDVAGNVVGIVTAGSTSAQGIGFAIPIAAASSIVSAALAGQSIS